MLGKAEAIPLGQVALWDASSGLVSSFGTPVNLAGDG